LIKPLRQVADKKWVKPPAMEELEKLQASLPKGAVLGEAVDAASEGLRMLIMEIRKARAEGFGRLVSEYIREMKAQGEIPIEVGSKWRFGEIELELKPETSQARALYNQASLFPSSGWLVITAKEGLVKLREKAVELLKESESRVPEALLKRLMAESYQAALEKRRTAGKPRADLVPILDLHRAFRVALVVNELDGQKPDKTLSSTTMPQWTFLHLLDRYQRMAGQMEQKDRLVFQPGSQAENARGMGYMLGGLDPHQKYRVYCHVLLNS
jgi:hypothetical protein